MITQCETIRGIVTAYGEETKKECKKLIDEIADSNSIKPLDAITALNKITFEMNEMIRQINHKASIMEIEVKTALSRL